MSSNLSIIHVYCLCIPVGALAWNGDMLSSGSRDRLILQRDARNISGVERRLIGHRQEVSKALQFQTTL